MSNFAKHDESNSPIKPYIIYAVYVNIVRSYTQNSPFQTEILCKSGIIRKLRSIIQVVDKWKVPKNIPIIIGTNSDVFSRDIYWNLVFGIWNLLKLVIYPQL